MPQTILAVLAMMLTMLFSLQVQRHVVGSHLELIRNELELQSTGVAEDVLGEVGASAFDENTKDATISDPSELTPEDDFLTADTGSDDIDDFHGCCTDDRLRTSASDTLRFDVDVEVTYADPDDIDQGAGQRTKIKKATVRVTNQDLPNATTITLSRSFACGSKCDW